MGQGRQIGTLDKVCPTCNGWGRLAPEQSQQEHGRYSAENEKISISKHARGCLQKKLLTASCRDQIISLLIFHRYRYPDQFTVSRDKIIAFYKELDFQVPSNEQLAQALKSKGIIRGYNADTFGVEPYLMNENAPQNSVIKPCLESDLRVIFIDQYERFLGKFKNAYPVWYRLIFVIGIIGSMSSIYCLIF
jgi:hypothetical protein